MLYGVETELQMIILCCELPLSLVKSAFVNFGCVN